MVFAKIEVQPMNNNIIIKEIMDFCDDNIDFYEELIIYACKHEREDWIKLLENKNARKVIASYLKVRCLQNNTRRKKPKHEMMRERIIAEAEYESKQYEANLKKIEEMYDKQHEACLKKMEEMHD